MVKEKREKRRAGEEGRVRRQAWRLSQRKIY